MSVGELLSLNVSNGGLWHLNGNSNDSGPNGNNGTDTAMTYSPANGKFGQGALFNGSTSFISFSDVASLKPTGVFTLGCWFRTSTTGVNLFIYQSYSANTNRAGIRLFTSTGNVMTFQTSKNSGTTQGTDWQQVLGNTNVTDGKFHLIIAVYDGVNLYIYVDGVLDGQIAWANNPAYAATTYMRVGCQNTSGSNLNFSNITGLDELFLMNGIALTAAQIKNYYTWALGRRTSVA